MLNKLRELNEKQLKKYEKEGSFKNITAQKIIKELLKPEDCFFKMTIEQAYTIFRELGFDSKDYEKIYLQLTKR